MWPFSDRRIAEREFARIVVRVPNPLGDQIMATPALDAIRARYPKAWIVGHGTPLAESLLGGAGWFDEFLVSGRREGVRAQARMLKKHRFDFCILLSGSFRSAVPPFLARIPHRLGYRWSLRTPLLTAHRWRPHPGGRRRPYPTKLFFRDLVSMIGADASGRVRLALTDDEKGRTEAWLAREGIGADERVLSVCVGAAFGPSKLWPAENFAAVIDHMAKTHDARVVLLIGPGEEEIGAAVAGQTSVPVIDTGRDLLDIGALKGVIARSRLLLTNDTGPRHIAASFRVPVVCIMGPTNPIYTDTDLEDQVVIRREDVECSPCHLKVCPIDHRCMVWIKPGDVIPAVEQLWGA